MQHPRFVLVRPHASFFRKIAPGLAGLERMVNHYAGGRPSPAAEAPSDA